MVSKLAHSNEETMNEIDRRRAIEDGNEDLIPPTSDTYQKPEHGWTCFHCGETFTTGSACAPNAPTQSRRFNNAPSHSGESLRR